MAFNPTNNPLLPPNTARLSNGITYILESTGFAQRAVEILADGTRGRVGPESTSEVFILFDEMYTSNAYAPGTGPTVEVNILPPIIENTPIAPIELEEVVITAPKKSTPKENSEARKKDLDEQTKNVQNNTEQPKGLAKFTPIILEKGNHITLTMAPALAEIAKDLFPSDPQIEISEEKIITNIKKLNGIIEDLNGISDFLTKITEVSAAINVSATVIQTISTSLKYSIPAISAAAKSTPIIPGIVVSVLDDLDWINNNLLYSNDGTPKLPKLISGVNAITGAIAVISLSILKVSTIIEVLIARLEALLESPVDFGPDDDSEIKLESLSPETKKFAKLGDSDFQSQDPLTYKGFVIKIETIPFTDTVNRYQAVGYTTQGVPLIKGELSFTSNALVLTNELKFIIDRDNLKAY